MVHIVQYNFQYLKELEIMEILSGFLSREPQIIYLASPSSCPLNFFFIVSLA